MSDVIGRGVIEVSGDASKLNAVIADARRTIASLGDSQKSASEKSAAAIDRTIQRLDTQSKTIAMTARETEIYKLSLRGATDEQLRSANAALKSIEAHQKNADMADRVKTGLLTLGTAASAGLIAAAVAFDQLIEKAGDFQDMAEKTGDTASNFASLAVSAQIGGLAMGDVADMANKLSKNLTGVDDESKSAGAAVKALGLNIDDLKNQSPTERFVTIARALNGFSDSADKSAVAMALLGKAGANSLPFLNELATGVGQVSILTEEQIKLADEYGDRQKRTSATISLYAQAIATQALPAMGDMKSAAAEMIKNLAGIQDGVKGLGNGKEIEEFADNVAISLAVVAESVMAVIKLTDALSGSFKSVAADTSVAFSFVKTGLIGLASEKNRKELSAAIDDRNKIVEEANKKYADLWNYDGTKLSSDLMARIEARKKGSIQSDVTAPEDAMLTGGAGKPRLKFDGAISKTGNENDVAKALRDLEVEQIRKQSGDIVSIYSNAQKVLEAERAANLIDEKTYYEARSGFIQLNEQEQSRALQAEIDRLKRTGLAGKDKLENDKKIVEAEAKLAKSRSEFSASAVVNQIQEEAALKKLAAAQENARQSAEAYLDTIRRKNALEVDGLGKGERWRTVETGRASIGDKFIDRRRELDGDLRRGQMTQQDYDSYIAIAKDTYDREIGLYDKRTQDLMDKQSDWKTGASEAFSNYADSSLNVAKQVENAFSNAFTGMEDSLVSFIKTGKLDFKSLADSIISDIIRIQVRAAMSEATKAIGGWFGSSNYNSWSGSTGASASNMTASYADAYWNANGNVFSGGSIHQYVNTVRDAPTPFTFGSLHRFASGGVFGEAGPEAVMPLARDSSGRLGVRAQGGAGDVTIGITINADSSDAGATSGGNKTAAWTELANRISAVVKQQIIEEKRNGGLLYPRN